MLSRMGTNCADAAIRAANDFNDPSPAMSLLRHPAYVRFLYVRVAASIALQIQVVAVGWQMYELTNSPFHLGLIGLVQFIPAIGLFVLTGHVADHYDRRRVTFVAQLIEALAVAVLAFANATGRLTPELLLAMAFVVGTGRAFEQPSLQSVLPNIVPGELLPRAIAGSTSASQTAVVAGPALGGMLDRDQPDPGLHGLRGAVALRRTGHARHRHGAERRGARAARSQDDVQRADLHRPPKGRARRRAARSVRGAARQSDRAAADLRPRHLSRRTARLRRVARRARRRRHRHRADPGALADLRPRRPHHVRDGGDLRRRRRFSSR